MKTVKGFVTRDDFVDNTTNVVAPLYEISDYGLTFSKDRKYYTYSLDSRYSLDIFNIENGTDLTQAEVDEIVNVITSFSNFVTSSIVTNKTQLVTSFVASYNLSNPTAPLTAFDYNELIEYLSLRSSDYFNFQIGADLTVVIWGADSVFRELYHDYSIDIVPPILNFDTLIKTPTDFLTALTGFQYPDFNKQIEANKENRITTYTSVLNIPYQVPGTTVLKDCYFGFNIYGQQGNYEFLLKLALYNYLLNTVALDAATIESIFPSILQINEFFITPRWKSVAIPSYVGVSAINSQIALAFSQPFDLGKFIGVYPDLNFLQANSYSVPFEYNNILLMASNGYYTDAAYKDFKTYYSDMITVSSTDIDFGRMSTLTQNFMILMSNMLAVADADNSTAMLNNIVGNKNYSFRVINRNGIDYLSIFYDKHQYYVLPRYEYVRLDV